jgi:hypothetical protein
VDGSGHIIELYADGTWYSDKAGELSLEEYFDWLKEKRAAATTAIAGRF